MALLETQADFTFAANIETLTEEIIKLNKALESCSDSHIESNNKLAARIYELNEVVTEQCRQTQQLLRRLGDVPATNNLKPDVVLI